MVARTQLQQQALEIHHRLLRGDPTASLDAADLLLDPLVNRLRAKWPGQNYIDECHDAATEVIVIYLEAPQRYDPARSALLTWLTMQAHGDLLNAYASPQKRFERGWIVESDLARDDSGGDARVKLGDQLVWLDAVSDLDTSQVLASVRAAFPEEHDRRLIWLMCIEGIHSTDDAAAVLDLMHLPSQERTAEVKRHKDRVMRRLRRLGLDEGDE